MSKNIKKIDFIFVGGKAIGYRCLSFLLKKKLFPKYLIPNLDDNGKNTFFHKSIVKLAKKNKIKILTQDKLINKLNLNRKKFDIIFCLGSTQILKKDILTKSKLGTLNLHPSLLPKYRGRYSLVHAIFNDEKFSGVTAHWIGNKIDTGKIICQKKFLISKIDTSKDVYQKFTNHGFEIFKLILDKVLKKKKIQSFALTKTTKYIKKSFPNNGQVNWNWHGKKIYNFFRSMIFEPFPPPFFTIGKKKYYIVSEELLNKKKIAKPPL